MKAIKTAALYYQWGLFLSEMASGGGPTIILGGGFSSINGMEFLGQSEAKGCSLHKCSRIFNVRETQKPDHVSSSDG